MKNQHEKKSNSKFFIFLTLNIVALAVLFILCLSPKSAPVSTDDDATTLAEYIEGWNQLEYTPKEKESRMRILVTLYTDNYFNFVFNGVIDERLKVVGSPNDNIIQFLIAQYPHINEAVIEKFYNTHHKTILEAFALGKINLLNLSDADLKIIQDKPNDVQHRLKFNLHSIYWSTRALACDHAIKEAYYGNKN